MVVIDLPEGSKTGFATGVSKILVPPIYETFWDLLASDDQRWQGFPEPKFSDSSHATIVTGQPGVGQCAIAYVFYDFDLLDLIHQESQSF